MEDIAVKIEEVLHEKYETDKFVGFVRELFPMANINSSITFQEEFSNFSSHIEGYYYIGRFQTVDRKRLLITAVQLKKEEYVESSRSTQRTFAKKIIENNNADAAFTAFYTKDELKWRLSFVRLSYEMKFENGRLKNVENITPAKRYSYLVGKDEPCHTAISRFTDFISLSSSNPEYPTLDDLEETFSVEKVTNEFFSLYCEKYQQLRETLEQSEDFRLESSQHNFTSVQFAKKLMGQIVFLYFLQKKGWLGVHAWPNVLDEKEYRDTFFNSGRKARELLPLVYVPVSNGKYRISKAGLESITDDDEIVLARCFKGKGNPWGTGPHDFMRRLFNLAKARNLNFFDDILEPLFYDTLNRNRDNDRGYCPALHCRVPFLSGGLFEPLEGYDWEHNDFSIPNEIFSNADLNGRKADGILDIFDRYNFTICEDEPLEREVAIDPEMLGKVFENLLEVQDRKSKGAFYTPREVVHYMCQESLIRYLTDALSVSEIAIRDFILYGEIMRDSDTEKTRDVFIKGKRSKTFDYNKELFISDELLSFKDNVNRLRELDEALRNVRIADPAVGSGAFLLGMLNEIVRARQNITAYLAIPMEGPNGPEARKALYSEREPYRLKRDTIRNSIFAADIEPSAVDIAKLRLWLSLVIDDVITPDAYDPRYGHVNPIPLPNLECNILCGNSLLDTFEGIRLIKESELLGNTEYQYDFNSGWYESVMRDLIETQNELFSCEDTSKKKNLMQKIQAQRDNIILIQLNGCSPSLIQRYNETKNMASKPFILWQLDFARVFREKGGFDIIIGNPPYIQLQKTIDQSTGEKLGDQYVNSGFETFAKTGDIYCLFYEKGFSLLHDNGVLSYITSNKWMKASYGEKLRNFFAHKTNPLCLIDFAGQKVFTSATVDVNILLFTKEPNKKKTIACLARDASLNNLSVFVRQNSSLSVYDTSYSWTILSPIEQSIKDKVDRAGMKLKDWNIKIYRGILTGCNEAFIISESKKDELISADPKSAEIIRPILRGKDIKRYKYQFANLWLIATFPSKNYDIENYPAVKDYLLSFGMQRLEQTGKQYTINGSVIKSRKKTNNKWFETQDSISYWDDFSKQKIVWGNLCLSAQFTLADEKFFINAPSPMIVPGEKYLLAILNSRLGDWYIRKLGVTRNGGYFEYKPMFIEQLPVPSISQAKKNEFEALVDKILYNKGQNNDTTRLEKDVDALVYKLYKLTDEEIRFLESNNH